MCPDSKASWPTVKDLAETVYKGKVAVTVHVFPLPYHDHAFQMAQAALICTDTKGTDLGFFPWLELVFKNQDDFGNDATANMSRAEVVGGMATMAMNKLGVASSTFLNGMAHSNTYDNAARQSWKYGCSRGVAGTPTFFINGVRVADAQPTWTAADWQKVIDPLL